MCLTSAIKCTVAALPIGMASSCDATACFHCSRAEVLLLCTDSWVFVYDSAIQTPRKYPAPLVRACAFAFSAGKPSTITVWCLWHIHLVAAPHVEATTCWAFKRDILRAAALVESSRLRDCPSSALPFQLLLVLGVVASHRLANPPPPTRGGLCRSPSDLDGGGTF